jgi:predicted nucleic acid-binding protein
VFPAFLDTCVLLRPYLCDALLSIAEAGLYRPLWSADVIAELRRNMIKRGLKDVQVDHRLDQMTVYFPDAEVTGYQELIPAMTNHPKDRHVLAAAIRGGADLLVTENLRDFPVEAVAPYDLRAVHQDEFLLDQLDLWPAEVLDALGRQTSRYRHTPRTARDLLKILSAPSSGCPRFAEACLRVL